ncbi:MAG: DUF4338 domain-containing protein [Deltaproteobacteria bacterium]|nr:DUF4338 domain-containing protein [Deltaproteobacteria bacterium]
MIEGTVRDCFGLSRTELAFTLCELLDWRRPNGQLKAHECRQFLEELEEKGLLKLPGNRGTGRKSKVVPKATGECRTPTPPVVEGTLADLGPVQLQLVNTPDDRRLWREWVSRYHYLGCTVPFGAHLRYFVTTSEPVPRKVGCVQMSSPAWRMAPRDKWIGWDEEQRVRGLQRIVQNSRFLLLPWVKIPHLASATLSRLARQIADDWETLYAVRPVLLETLVDPAKFKGTCYRAANWLPLGITTGRGRMDREHKRHGAEPKEVLVYPLRRKAREILLKG